MKLSPFKVIFSYFHALDYGCLVYVVQELEDLLEKYEADSQAWQEEEDQYKEIIEVGH